MNKCAVINARPVLLQSWVLERSRPGGRVLQGPLYF
jgi:hypothetical protein